MTDKGRVELAEGLIIANRHIHIDVDYALELGLVEDQQLSVLVENEKSGSMDAFVKITNNAYFEMHIDRDDANAFMLNNGDCVTLKR